MEFVMIVEPDEVGRKRLEAVFQTEKPSFSYQITGELCPGTHIVSGAKL